MTLRELLITTTKWGSVVSDPVMGRRPGPRLLIYHQVGAGSGLEMDVSPQAFQSQLDWLESHGQIVDLQTAIARSGEPDSSDLYVLTFDDGHAGVFEHGYPVLRERGMPFTLYLTTEPIEKDGCLHGDHRMRLLSWSQIEEMMSSGLITIGAHSHRHLDMRLHEEATIGDDLATCDLILEKRLGVRPRHFAYPWGHWGEIADRLVREHYETAVLGSGKGITAGEDIHKLHRVPVMASDIGILFKRKMWGGFRLESGVRTLRDTISGP